MFRSIRRTLFGGKRKYLAIGFAVLALPGSAMAAYILSATGNGQTTGTLGTAGTQAVTVTVTANLDGLSPGNSVPYVVNAKDAGANGARVASAPSIQVTTSDMTACPASNFAVNPTAMTYPVTVPAAPSSPVKVAEGNLTFVNSGDQNGCSGKTLTLKATL
jgi:hypothetical protein